MRNELGIFRIKGEFKTSCGKAVTGTNSTPKKSQNNKTSRNHRSYMACKYIRVVIACH